MQTSLQRRFAALAAAVALLVVSAPRAFADPAAGGAVADAPTLTLSDLGSPGVISFFVYRDSASAKLSFPVPPGLAPDALNATLEVPMNLRFGELTVTQDARTISRLAFPPRDQPGVVIPLAGAKIKDNSVTVDLTVTAAPLEDYCWDPLSPIRLVDTSVRFAGKELAPTTVATVLPPALRKVTIALPSKPSQPESDAAVQLAAAMAARYAGQNINIAILPLADGATALPNPSVPLERQIIVKEGPSKGLSLQGGPGVPALLVSGPGNELADQARLVMDDSLRYALSRSAAVGQTHIEQRSATEVTTLEQLGYPELSSEALWPEVSIAVDQTRFGRPLEGIRVHLLGSHTPLPQDTSGEVIASVDGKTLGRWPADAAGVIDHWVDIPNKLTSRLTTLQVAVRTTGDAGHCGDYLPITLSIDGSTQIEAKAAVPAAPVGFQSLPQAFMPWVRIGIGGDAFADTARAARIVVGLQGVSAVPLMTAVTSLQEAINSRDPAILISADGWTDTRIRLPFSADKGRVTVEGTGGSDEPVTLTLDPAIAYGSLQTVVDQDRTLLVATSNGAPEQLDELLRWLSGDGGRWPGLDGRAAISVSGSEPVIVPTAPKELFDQPAVASPPAGHRWMWLWWAGGAALALVVVGGAVYLLTARRS